MSIREAVIVSAARTPVGRAPRGTLRAVRPDDLAAIAIAEAVRRATGLAQDAIDDVVVGCAMPEAEQGLNVARIALLRAGLPVSVPAMTVNRFCASGLEAIAIAADRIRSGAAEIVVAGGVESMSLVPMAGHRVSPNPALVSRYPDAYITTGLVAEIHARERGITREAQDAFAVESHRRAVAAQDAGRFDEEIVAVPLPGAPPAARDDGPRRETSAAALAALRPVFQADGTVTAGNASQTSDGAAAVVVMSAARADELGLAPLARIAAYVTAGIEPERFGLGPVPAMRALETRTGARLADVDLVEVNEAFASQVLACLQDVPIDPARLNVNGGAIALGHPLGCTGARLVTSIVHEMRRRGARTGVVTACVGGGMGVAMLLER